jgi:hypothetical protein
MLSQVPLEGKYSGCRIREDAMSPESMRKVMETAINMCGYADLEEIRRVLDQTADSLWPKGRSELVTRTAHSMRGTI